MCKRTAPTREGLPPKGILIDSMGTCSIVAAAVVYFLIFIVCVIIGVMGPPTFSAVSNAAADIAVSCTTSDACTATWYGTLTDMAPDHQFMWLEMTMTRPLTSSGTPALATVDVEFELVYQIDLLAVQNDGTFVMLAQNQSHVAPISFRADEAGSSSVLLFATQEVRYPTYKLTARFMAPLGPFSQQVNIVPSAMMHFTMSFVNKLYTSFELGWKMFFVTVSGLIWILYSALLCCGPGALHETTFKRLPSTIEQAYVWWLGLGLIFFNDPFFPLEISSPSIVTSGWTAFCTVTFLASLLMFWLVMFDTARLQGEGGLVWQLGADASNSLGVLFWMPKVILMTVFWTLSLAAYMYLRYSQLSDPSFNIVGDLGTTSVAPIARWFYVVVSCLLGAYMLYLFALIVLSCRHFTSLRPSNRFLTSLTLCTIIVLLVGLYLNVFTPVYSSSAAFLVAYAAPNLYVWWLQLAFVPGPRLPQWFADLLSDDEVRLRAAHAAIAGGAVDTTGALGGGEADDVQILRGNSKKRSGGGGQRRRGGDDEFSIGIEEEEEAEAEAAAAAAATAAASAVLAAHRRARISRMAAAPRRAGAPPPSAMRNAGGSGGGGSRRGAPAPLPPTPGSNIVSFYGENDEEVLRAAAYTFETGEMYYVGDDGVAFVLDEAGQQVFLDMEGGEAAPQPAAPGPAAPQPAAPGPAAPRGGASKGLGAAPGPAAPAAPPRSVHFSASAASFTPPSEEEAVAVVAVAPPPAAAQAPLPGPLPPRPAAAKPAAVSGNPFAGQEE